MKLRWITVLAALLAPVLTHAQTRINPNSQINWPLSTGASAPTLTCTALNYGQPYTNSTTGQGYTCTSLGWTASGGGGGGQGTVNNGAAFAPVYYPAAGTAVSGATPFTGPGCYSTTAPPALCTSSQLQSVIGSGIYDLYGSAASAATAAAAAQATANNAIPKSSMGVPNGVATLGSTGVIPTNQIPSIAISDIFPVTTQAAMLALSAAVGNVAIVTQDPTPANDGSYVLLALPASTLSNWALLVTPSSGVQSVNGQVGTVALTFANLPGTITATQLPYPTTTTLGGVEAIAPVANEWVSSISNLGVPILTQPTLASFSGALACSQLPALTGGVSSTGCALTLTPGSVAAALAGQNISIGAVTATNMTNSSFTAIGDCVTVGAGGQLTESPCGGGGGDTLTAPVTINSTVAAANVSMLAAVDPNLASGNFNLIQVGSASSVTAQSSVLGWQYGAGGFIGLYGDPQATFNSTGAWVFPTTIAVTGAATVASLTDTALTTTGDCVLVAAGGTLTQGPCSTGVQLNVANTWTATQTFSAIAVTGASNLAATSTTTLTSTSFTASSIVNTSTTTVGDCVIVGTGGLYTQGTCGNGAQLNVANLWTALQSFSDGITVSGATATLAAATATTFNATTSITTPSLTSTGTSTLAAATATTLHATTSITDSGLTTVGDCVTVGTGGLLSQAPCGSGFATLGANTFTGVQTISFNNANENSFSVFSPVMAAGNTLSMEIGQSATTNNAAYVGYEAGSSTATVYELFGILGGPITSFSATGAWVMPGTMSVAGATTLSSTLGVTGATTLASLGVTGAETVGTTLGVAGALSVTGATASLKATTVTSLTDSGLTTVGDCVTVGTGGLLSQAACGAGFATLSANTFTGAQNIYDTSVTALTIAQTGGVSGVNLIFNTALTTTGGDALNIGSNGTLASTSPLYLAIGYSSTTNNEAVFGYTSTSGGSSEGFIGLYNNPSTYAIYNNIGAWTFPSSIAATLHASTVSTVASATTIAPTTSVVNVSGTATISTITPPTGLSSTVGGCLTFIATGAWSTTTGGNIASVTLLAVANTAYQACYNGTSWFIK